MILNDFKWYNNDNNNDDNTNCINRKTNLRMFWQLDNIFREALENFDCFNKHFERGVKELENFMSFYQEKDKVTHVNYNEKLVRVSFFRKKYFLVLNSIFGCVLFIFSTQLRFDYARINSLKKTFYIISES